ncbi:AMP-binding protein [Ammoniphilus sp. YIM 78166]|uniref:AMP-binding protein n=1 Tax=Ammoniphilus sp. YIM 78166 TaxID=1644106 RepID=UPI00106F2D3E|nr:AMP-binding protein [Ammoniphilus sp. YIM 78166]
MTRKAFSNTRYEPLYTLAELAKKTAPINRNLFNVLVDAADEFGYGKKIIEDIERSISYKDLLLATYVLSGKLEPLLKGQQNIGIFLPNSIGHVVTLFSLFKLGKTPAILNFSMGEANLRDCGETAGLRTILTSRKFLEKANLEALMESLSAAFEVIYLEDVREKVNVIDKVKGLISFKLKRKATTSVNEVVLFTSGSESKPKGVILTHDNIFANLHQALNVIDLTLEDRFFNPLPMFHSFGLTVGTMLPLLNGMYVIAYPSPLHYKEIPELIRERKATALFGTSTFLEGYEKYAGSDDFRTLRYVIAGAERLKEQVITKWEAKFRINLLEGYGTTEAAPILSLNTPTHQKKGSVGRLLPLVEARIEPVEGISEGGKLLVKGPNLMKGYLLHNQGFIPREEWYDTGDVVTLDEEGYVTIQARLKRFAKVAGEMISLNQVEQMAAKCFGSPGFFAVSVPDERRGEKVILFTTLEEAEEKELAQYIRTAKQSNLLIPQKMLHIEEVPVLGSGKTDYVTLTELAKGK